MKIFCWEEIYNLFSCSFEEIKNSTDSFFLDGTAISVGCFDGPHLGHKFLFSSVLKYSKDNHLKSGLVTFLRPLPSLKFKNEYLGDIATLNQRLSEYEKLGFDFVVVIDFSSDFSKMEGTYFLSILTKVCNMKFLAEGKDFRCGYKGSCSMENILEFAKENNIVAHFPDLVFFDKKRISSSDVRKHIYNADFDLVQKFLERSYELDVTDVKMEIKENTFSFNREDIKQVLPMNGMYDVFAILPESRLRTRLEVCSQYINLWGTSGNAIPRIRAIEFILNGGK